MSNKKRILAAVSPKNIQISFNIIADKLGKNPDELLINFNNGVYDKELEELNTNELNKLINVLNSSFLLRMALASPNIVKMLEKIID